jgi:hypothetical protein
MDDAYNAGWFRPVRGVRGWSPYLVSKDGDTVLINATAGFADLLRDAGHTVTAF